MAQHYPAAKVTGIDASDSAISLAKNNADSLSLSNVTFKCANWRDAISENYDIIFYENAAYVSDEVNITNKVIEKIQKLSWWNELWKIYQN